MLLDRIVDRLSRLGIMREASSSPPVPLTLRTLVGPVGGRSTAEEFLKAYGEIGWLYAAVSSIAYSTAAIPLKLQRKAGQGDPKPITAHPLIELLDHPNPFWSGVELRELLAMYLKLLGESYLIVNMNTRGEVAELWPVYPTNMHPVASETTFIAGFEYRKGTYKEFFPPDRVIWFREPDPANLMAGVGAVKAIATDLDSELYASQWNRNFFLNDATPGGILTTEGNVSDDKREGVERQWMRQFKGVSQAHRVAILEGGLTFQKVALGHNEMGFAEMRNLNRDIILGALHVPQSIIGISETVNRATAETEEYIFATRTIKPLLSRIVSKFNETIARIYGVDIEFAFDDPTPANREADRLDAESMMRVGSFKMNEIRKRLGYPETPDGEVYVAPLSVVLRPIAPKPLTPEDILPPEPPPDANPDDNADDNADENPDQSDDKPTDNPDDTGDGNDGPPGDGKALRFVTQGEPNTAPAGGLLSAEQKDAWSKSIEAKQEQRVPRWRLAMNSYWGDEGERVVLALEEQNKSVARSAFSLDFDWVKETLDLGELMKLHLGFDVEEIGQEVMDEFGFEQEFNSRAPTIQEWIGERMRRHSKWMTDETRDAVTAQLRLAEAEGETSAQMVARVRGYYDGIDYRAERTARTEVVGSSNRAAYEAYRQASIEKSQWWAYLDNRTRDAHAAAHEQVRALGLPFDVGGELIMHPGEGSAGNAINCRCTIVPVIEG